MRRLACLVLVALVAAPAATASPRLHLGITDSGAAYYGNGTLYATLGALHASYLRVHLNWGGKLGVARRKPVEPTDPADPAYDWRLYDRIVLSAAEEGVGIVFTVFGTPAWANGGRLPTHAPRDADDLTDFAYAAALRYSGTYAREDGVVLPKVTRWTAWNEPNLPLGLVPQWRRVGKRWVPQSALDYARICNAVVDGVHATVVAGERVACGVTTARGNNNPRGDRPTVSPLVFLRAAAKAGMRGFDAYAHHPYAGGPAEAPTTRPPHRGAVTLANIGDLERELRALYRRRVPIWLTEYGYQTNPPDPFLGVTYAKQAAYLRQAVAIARRDPQIDLLLWFLVADEADVARWQSGLETVGGVRKPAFAAFAQAAVALG